MKSISVDQKIKEMAKRIRELREIEGLTPSEMAKETDVPVEEYLACERGERDLNFAFIYLCANALAVNVTDIIEGYSPNLASYTVTRKGEGQRIADAHGMTYYNLAYAFRNRIAEPLYVTVPFDPEKERTEIECTTHAGQECDIVIEGSLKVKIGEHEEVLNAGDSVYYNSGTPHGMVAVGGKDCIFYAIVLNPTGEPIPELMGAPFVNEKQSEPKKDRKDRIYKKFIDAVEDENGAMKSITFKNTEKFNFAFDLVDALAEREPDKLAMLYVGKDGKEEKRFTFLDMKKESNRCANYFKSIGIKKGDRVMLVLKRHYQFWFAMLGLNKLGAIAIPATYQLQEHDFSYRFESAGVSAILCTADGITSDQVDIAEKDYGKPMIKIIVNGKKEGWRSFDEDYKAYSTHFLRNEDSPCGDDTMLMFFTSGTSGYPKIAAHNYKYPLGHFVTAKYWHAVDPDGLHFTISDTGWAKSMWGKLYGQWLCEAATFVFDFDKFDAATILPMFKKYNITTFCAPPTMLRMMIKENISLYDFSSVKHMTTAGEALNAEVYRQFEKLTGLQIHEGFGQSESTVIIGNLIGYPHKVGSMGKACTQYKIKLLTPDGKEAEVGEVGEICVDVSQGAPCGLFTGYYKDKEKTEEVWHDGFYHTGDNAWKDEDGYFWYVGRVDDVIKSSGYRIGPFEIESVIMELPY
ncbi:MAG: AMP-binding protein, partial [Clostridia bacterium]|nr:AMP-binding protein [Clostridia bacterium]